MPAPNFESVCIKRRLNCGNGVLSRLFPPRHSAKTQIWHNKGRQSTSYLTINGRVKFIRPVFWNRQDGTVIPLDNWLGLGEGRYSPGVREMCCREASSSSFRIAAEDLARIGQICISHRPCERLIRFGQPLPDKTDFLMCRLLTGLTEAINACFWLHKDLLRRSLC